MSKENQEQPKKHIPQEAVQYMYEFMKARGAI